MKLCALRLVAAVLCALLVAQVAAAADRFPGTAWERVDPEAAGWSTSKLAKAEQWSQRIGSTAVMVVHRGAVVAEALGDPLVDGPRRHVQKLSEFVVRRAEQAIVVCLLAHVGTKISGAACCSHEAKYN